MDARTAVMDYSSASIRPGAGDTSGASLSLVRHSAAASAGQPLPTYSLAPATATPGQPGTRPTSPLRGGARGTSPSMQPGGHHSDNGFAVVDAAMARLHAHLSDTPLTERWAIMAAWLNRYMMDREADQLTETVAVVWDRLLCSQHEAPLHGGKGDTNDALTVKKATLSAAAPPSGLRTAVALMIFEQLLALFGRGVPDLVETCDFVRDEVLNAIYVVPVRPRTLHATFQLLLNPNDAVSQQRLIERFYGKTYFQSVRELSAQLFHDAKGYESQIMSRDKRLLVMDRAIDVRRKTILSLNFGGWKGYVKGRKIKKERLQKDEEMSTLISRRDEDLERARSQHAAQLETLTDELETRAITIVSLQARLDQAEGQVRKAREEADQLRKELEDDTRYKNLLREHKQLKTRMEAELSGHHKQQVVDSSDDNAAAPVKPKHVIHETEESTSPPLVAITP